MTTLSIVIPAYNEEDGILTIIDRVLGVRPQLKATGTDDVELIVVDDGSSDRTAALVLERPEVRLVQHAHNSGYGAALKTGFAAAQGEWVGFLDADGTYPPEQFPDLMQAARAQNADVVIGSRMAGTDSKMPAMRRLGNVIFAHLVSIISATKITDSASGMRVFKKSVLAQLYPLPDGLNLTPVMSTRALHEHLKMIEVPITYSERIGRSKLSVVHDGMRFAQSIVWTSLYYNPVRALGIVGSIALALAAIIGIGLVLARLQGIQSVSSVGVFAVFSALVLAVAGVCILALGLSFNYFVALFHRTPVRQGLFGRSYSHVRIEHHFGWIGLLALVMGLGLALMSLALALNGWTLTQLWIYYLVSACVTLIGIQLVVAWIQMQVLDTLRIREDLAADDLKGKERLPSTAKLQPGVAQ